MIALDPDVAGARRLPANLDFVSAALAEPDTALRLFGKPESFLKRRMGVALAHDPDVEQARRRAKQAAACITPRRPAA